MADTKCVLNQRQTETSSVSLALREEDVGVGLRCGTGGMWWAAIRVCSWEASVCRGVGASLPVISCGDKRTLCKTHKFYSILISFILFFCSALFCSVSFRFFFYMLFVVVVALSLYTHTRKVSSPPHTPVKLIQFFELGSEEGGWVKSVNSFSCVSLLCRWQCLRVDGFQHRFADRARRRETCAG